MDSDQPNDGDNIAETPSTLLTIPAELLIYLISFLATRDRVNLRYVSSKLRCVCETPSLWREFVWPYWRYNGDESGVNGVLKVCGEYVKHLSFYHGYYGSASHWPPAAERDRQSLRNFLGYCINLTELSLPTFEIDPEQLGKSLLHMGSLQKLDVQYHDIQALLKAISINLKELTIRKVSDGGPLAHLNAATEIIGTWVDYWMSIKLTPQKLNIVTAHGLWRFGTHPLWQFPIQYQYAYPSYTGPLVLLLNKWIKFNAKSPAGHTGTVKLYSRPFKDTLNLSPTYPLFQLTFGNNATSPVVRASGCGLPGDLLVLTDTTYGGRVMFKATTSDILQDKEVPSYSTINSLEFVTEFNISFNEALLSEHLKQLAVACPNLQRLNLLDNKYCLRNLEGIRTIVSYCHNLQGLNLMGIPVTEVEDQTQLWELLSDLKLTHLAVNMCVLLPNEQHGLFQKFANLQALESRYHHCNAACTYKLVDKCLMVLSQFPSLIHVIITINHHRRMRITSPQLPDILSSCQKLKYLRYTQKDSCMQFLSPTLMHNLEQIYIKSKNTDLSDTFLSTLSAHGGLVHVVLYVRSVTTEGVSVLVKNSPKLMGFHATLYGNVSVDSIYQLLGVKEFCNRQLCLMGNFTVFKNHGWRCSQWIPRTDENEQHQCITKLSSLW